MTAMPVDPQIRQVIDALAASEFGPVYEQTPAEARDAGGPAIRLQVLVYPVTDYACDTGSYRTYAKGYGMLEAASMRWFRDSLPPRRGGPDRLAGGPATRRRLLRPAAGTRCHRASATSCTTRARRTRSGCARRGWRWSTGRPAG